MENEIDSEGAKTKSYLNYQAGPYNFDFSYSNNTSTGEEIYETSVGIGTKDNQVYGKHSYSSTNGHSLSVGAKGSVKKEVGGWTVEAKADISATIKLD